jgi:Spy/CpxP family protein refolding chaperone
LLIFSLAFNIAFVGIWTYHFAYVRPRLDRSREASGRPADARAAALLRRLAQLDLTRAQKQRLRQDYAQLRDRLREHTQPLKNARHEYLMLLQDPDADAEQLQAAQKDFARRQNGIQQAIFEHLLRIRQELTPRQRRAFGRMLYRAHGRHTGDKRRQPTRPRKKRPQPQNPRSGKENDAF